MEYNALLAVYAGCGELQRGLSTLRQMPRAGAQPDAGSLLPLMRAALLRRQVRPSTKRGELRLSRLMVLMLPVGRWC